MLLGAGGAALGFAAGVEGAAGGAEIPKPTAEYQNVIEKRVWAVDYARQGDEFRPDDDPIAFVAEK